MPDVFAVAYVQSATITAPPVPAVVPDTAAMLAGAVDA
jgi:hypothetical protein